MPSYKKVQDIPSINLPEFNVLKCFYEESAPDVYYFEIEPKSPFRGPCPSCGSRPIYSHGETKRLRLIHDISIGLTKVDLLLHAKRYQCKDCGKTFTHPLGSVNERRKMTNRLIEVIEERSFKEPFKTIAREYGLTIPVISNILNEKGKVLDARRVLVAPRVLGIDENHLGKKQRGVLTDIEEGTLLEITSDRRKETIKKAILSMENYSSIRIVTMDMSLGYRDFVYEILPHAVIIVDKFHVAMHISRAVTRARIEIYEALKAQVEGMPSSSEKARKSALLTEMGKDTYLFKYSTKKLRENPKRLSLMASLCLEFPEINELRLVKEAAESIYLDSPTREEADARFSYLTKIIPPEGAYTEFRRFTGMFTRWKPEILNYFEYGGFTNATTEGVNSLIKSINQQGRGYSFKNLRYKALFTPVAHKERIVKSRPVPKREDLLTMSMFTVSSWRPEYIKGDRSDIKTLLDSVRNKGIF